MLCDQYALNEQSSHVTRRTAYTFYHFALQTLIYILSGTYMYVQSECFTIYPVDMHKTSFRLWKMHVTSNMGDCTPAHKAAFPNSGSL